MCIRDSSIRSIKKALARLYAIDLPAQGEQVTALIERQKVCLLYTSTLDENLNMIRESIAYLKDKNREVIFDAEHFFDGFKANSDYALQVLETAEAAGADWIILCDTNGGSMPWEIAAIVSQVSQSMSSPLGIHAHNDAGCAVSNSVSYTHLDVYKRQLLNWLNIVWKMLIPVFLKKFSEETLL